MEFSHLLKLLGDEPVFESGLLLAGNTRKADVQRQLSRWASAGKLHQFRKGVYALAPPFAKRKVHPFVVANAITQGTYVSLQSALAHHGLIPEYTPAITSVGVCRPASWVTPLGRFEFRRIKPAWFRGYAREEMSLQQHAFVAKPEKALLDLAYLSHRGDDAAFLRELRLQNLDRLDADELMRLARESASPKLLRAAKRVLALAQDERAEFETL